ncbi:MAG: potassium channel protein [Chloroflexi bacterium]|nr:potassium channel protein [Chloroflexota bacterium]
MIARPPARLSFAIALLVAIVAFGSAWYAWVEDFGAFDGLYMAIITLTTVGYEEVQPLDDSGRIFTMLYVLAGIGVMFYVAGSIVEELVVGGVAEALGARRETRKAERLRDHIVIAGQGRVGREVLRMLRARGEQVLAIDAREERLEFAREHGALALLGDATDEAVLRHGHVDRARTLVAAADSDAVNTFIVLSARAMHPDLRIIARAASEGSDRRLESAGADRVISPYQIAGRRMAVAAVQPLMLDFIDTLTTNGERTGLSTLLAEIEVSGADHGLAGATVEALFRGSEVRLVAIVHAGGELTIAPPGPTVLRDGDRLMLYGAENAIEALASAVGLAGRAGSGAAGSAASGSGASGVVD